MLKQSTVQKNTNSRSDGFKCKMCGEKVSRRCEAAPTLQRSALQGRLFSSSAHNQAKYKAEAKPRTGNLPSVSHYPSTKSSPVKLRSSKISLRPCHILRNGGNNSSGERRHLGSTLLPWKYDKMSDGLSPKQKKFCSLWNTFL